MAEVTISQLDAAASAAATDKHEIETAGGASKYETNAQILAYIEGAIGTAAFRALLDDADAAALRTTIGAQASDAELTALAGLTSAADKLPYFTGSGTASLADLTSAGRALLDDANAAAQLTTLGAAPLASPTFTGTPAAPTASGGTNTTQIATTAFVQSAVSGVSGSATFKQTKLIGNTNKTTTSTSFTAIDSTNLAYLTLTLAIGDVVRITFQGQGQHSAAPPGSPVGIDFEVDQPTSANVRASEDAEWGSFIDYWNNNRQHMSVVTTFTATEAGSHGFRPVWKVSTGTATLANGTSGGDDTAILFMVEKLGAPAS